MRLQANTHSAFPISTPLRHTLAGRTSVVLSVLAALLLITSFIGPSAFILAEKAGNTPHRLQTSVLVATGSEQISTGSSSQALNHSPDQLDKATDKEGGKKSSSGKKRPRGTLHSNDRVSSAVASLASYEGIQFQVDDGYRTVSTASVDPILKSNLLPPQLLQRPPPQK